MNMNNRQKIKVCVIYTLLFLSSLLLILLYNGDSPLYYLNTAPDNTVYKAVAQRMIRGEVLYSDIYEHKGLYLYFYYILKEFINPFVIELILDLCFVFLVYRSLRIFQGRKCAFYCAIFINVVDKSFGYLYHFGGQSETIGKVILICIIYMILKNYYIYHLDRMDKNLCFIAGILTMVLFMIKYTMTIFILTYIVALYIASIKNKKVYDLRKSTRYFIAGLFVGFIPALSYFISSGSFIDFIRVYLFDVSTKYEPSAVTVWPAAIFAIAIIMVLFTKKKVIRPTDMLLVSCVVALVFTSIATRVYYFGYCMPFIVVLFICLDRYVKDIEEVIENSSWFGKTLAIILYLGVLIALPVGFHADMHFMTEAGFSNVAEGCDGSLKDVADIVNSGEDKTFLSRTDNCIIYLLTDTLPDTRYFINYNMVLVNHKRAYALAHYVESDNYVNQAFNQYIDQGSHRYILQYECNYINHDLYEKVGTYCSNGNYGKVEVWALYRRR